MVLGVQSVKIMKIVNASTLEFPGVRRCLEGEWCQFKRRRSLFELTENNLYTLQTPWSMH